MKRKGITIVELLVFVIIVGILAAVFVPSISPMRKTADKMLKDQALIDEYTEREDYKEVLWQFQRKTGTYLHLMDANYFECYLKQREKELALEREAVMGFFEFKAAREKNQN